MTKKNQNRFWIGVIIGLLSFGIGMIIWTVKQASSVPVHESNNYMLKYQQADMNINDIIHAKQDFDKLYNIKLQNVELITLTGDDINSNSKRKQANPIKLTKGANSFSYTITDKSGTAIPDANVTFLLTQPHSRNEDVIIENVPFENGHYQTEALNITKAGRYTLQFRAYLNDTIGYLETAAYLQP
jgi:hypothetical protein